MGGMSADSVKGKLFLAPTARGSILLRKRDIGGGGPSVITTGNNYHLLGRPLRQGVPVAQVVDLNVFDVITVRDINLGVQLS